MREEIATFALEIAGTWLAIVTASVAGFFFPGPVVPRSPQAHTARSQPTPIPQERPMARRLENTSLRATNEKTHVQDGPRPERSDHSNLDPQERTPHPTVRPRRARTVHRLRPTPAHVRVHGRPH